MRRRGADTTTHERGDGQPAPNHGLHLGAACLGMGRLPPLHDSMPVFHACCSLVLQVSKCSFVFHNETLVQKIGLSVMFSIFFIFPG